MRHRAHRKLTDYVLFSTWSSSTVWEITRWFKANASPTLKWPGRKGYTQNSHLDTNARECCSAILDRISRESRTKGSEGWKLSQMGKIKEHCHSCRQVSSKLPIYETCINICCRDEALLESLVAEVEKNVDGKRVSVEGEDDAIEEAKESWTTSTSLE